MTTNLAMDLRRIARENERQRTEARPAAGAVRQQPTELQRIFRRLAAAGS